MKIVQLKAENIKKLRAVEITPGSAVVQITGANGSGKTSVLDSIYWALAGTKEIASQPIRKGEQKASIRLDLGEIVVTRRFTAAGTTLTVEAANGARFPSPQKMLDDLLGTLTFDPLEFTRLKPAAQLEQLRALVKLDVDIDALDAQNKVDYASRTDVNRDAKQLEAQIAAVVVPDGLPAEAIDVSALLQRIESASQHNSEIEGRRIRRAQVRERIASDEEAQRITRAEAENFRARAAQLDADADVLEVATQELRDRLAAAEDLPEPIDTAAVRVEIELAQETNKAIEARGRRDELKAQHEQVVASADALTADMEARTKQRQDAIAAAVMPVPDLSFGDGQVLYRGLPFDQASGAEQLRISIAIAIAMNPKLRVLRIKDGSLLDENGLQLIADMAETADFQCWIERVDTSGRVGVVMEDGHIAEQATESAA